MSYVQDFSDLPDELILEVAKLLQEEDIIKLSKTDKRLNGILQDNNFWYDIVVRDTGKVQPYNSEIVYKKLYPILKTILEKYNNIDYMNYFVNRERGQSSYLYYFARAMFEKLFNIDDDVDIRLVPEELEFEDSVNFFKFLADNSLFVDSEDKTRHYQAIIEHFKEIKNKKSHRGVWILIYEKLINKLGDYIYDIIDYDPKLLKYISYIESKSPSKRLKNIIAKYPKRISSDL